ncbi:MAG: cation:proton antiporter, partial [Demequina sp.]|nr:cation:proton antiporter [Demequina sp.]
MHASTVLVIILAAGLGSQWIAAKLRLPGILVMIAAGLVLGPLTGVVRLDVEQAELTELVGLGVAIVLFEGAMDLRLGEFRKVGAGVRRLTIVGPPLAWALGATAAHYAGRLSWPVSWVLGAILVVTGPTVILPLLRQARLRKDVGSLLKWEGIVNDPVGVLLAVLTFQFLTLSGEGVASTAVRMLAALAAAAVAGGGGGWLVAKLYRRGWVPPHLKGPLLVVLVPGVFWVTN